MSEKSSGNYIFDKPMGSGRLQDMRAKLRLRWVVWKDVLWNPLAYVAGGLWSLYGLFSAFRGELSPEWQERLRIVNWIPPLPWWAWVIGMLIIVLAALLEGSYRVISGLNAKLQIRVTRQTIRTTLNRFISRIDPLLIEVNNIHGSIADQTRAVMDWAQEVYTFTNQAPLSCASMIFLGTGIERELSEDVDALRAFMAAADPERQRTHLNYIISKVSPRLSELLRQYAPEE